MNATSALIAPLATVLVVCVTFAGFTITKDLKTTESRQRWINDQRSDLAIVISIARRLAQLDSAAQKAFDLTKFEAATARIMLREKPRERFGYRKVGNGWEVFEPGRPDWAQTVSAVRRIADYASAGMADPKLVDCALARLTVEARRNLKIEWERVKVGERGYRRTKRGMVCAGGIVIATSALIALATGAFDARKPLISLEVTRR